jgi:hypothetical protein
VAAEPEGRLRRADLVAVVGVGHVHVGLSTLDLGVDRTGGVLAHGYPVDFLVLVFQLFLVTGHPELDLGTGELEGVGVLPELHNQFHESLSSVTVASA